MVTEKIWLEYRIMSKRPGDSKWVYRRATRTSFRASEPGALEPLPSDLAILERWIARHTEQSPPGWKFKVQTRVFRILTTDWKDLPK